MEIKSIDHTGIIVKDLDKVVDFYTTVMGFSLVGEITPWAGSPEECVAMQVPDGTEYRCAVVQAPGERNIQFMEFSNMEPPVALNIQGVHYLSFMVDDIAAWIQKLEENGCKAMSNPIAYDDYGTTIQWCYVTDPNGITFELISAT